MARHLTQYLPWLAPRCNCLLCGIRLAGQRPLCVDCELDLPWLGAACQICALPLPVADQTCPRCQRRPPSFHQVVAPWRYGYPLDTLIIRFKHHGQWPIGRLLAELLAEHLQQRFTSGQPRPDALVAVPLSDQGLRQRGFNQAQMLGQRLTMQLRIPLRPYLQRIQNGPRQQSLNASARRRNLRGAFALAPKSQVRGLHLGLVDDVLTTGSTADTLARLLLRAGAAQVDVYCLARTPAPDVAIDNGTHKTGPTE